MSAGLNSSQQRALAALLSHSSIAAAARACGLHERTLRRYLEEAAFRDAFDTALSSAVEYAADSLRAASGEAVEALRGVMGDNAAPASARVRAAHVVLQLVLRHGVDRLEDESDAWGRSEEEIEEEYEQIFGGD